jgi:hypothetical protein
MSYTIKIDNEYLPSYIVVSPGTLKLDTNENDKKILSFDLKDRLGNDVNYLINNAAIGKKIELYEDGILKFGGQIDSPDSKKFTRTLKKTNIKCVDWNFLTEIRYINRIYYKQPISDIVKKIVDEYFADDGVWYDSNSIETVTNELAIKCSYEQAQNILDEISDLVAFKWKIGDNRKFYFLSRSSIIGPNIIEEQTNYKPESLLFSPDRSLYRNKQIFKNVNALTSLLTEKATPTPDADNAFTVRLPLDSKPEIWITDDINDLRENDGNYYKVDEKYVGIGGVSEGLVWYYWNKNSNIISKDPDNAPSPAATFFIVVKYVGQFKFDLVREDYDQINERAEIEGTSGVYESIEDGSNIDGISVAESKISAYLQKYSQIAKKIMFSSHTLDIAMHSICKMTFPSFELNESSFLLIHKKLANTGGDMLLKTYTFISGDAFNGWVNFFKKWLEKGKNFYLRESEEVIQQVQNKEYALWDGTITITIYNCLYPAVDLFPSPTLTVGTFEETETFGEEG